MVLGSTLGGLFVGGVIAFVHAGMMKGDSRAFIFALSTFAFMLHVGGILLPRYSSLLPYKRSQVRRELLDTLGPTKAALSWGLELGMGFRTYIVTPALFSVVAIGLLLPAHWGLALLGVYGVARGTTIWALAEFRRRRDPECVISDALFDGKWRRLSRWPLLALGIASWASVALPVLSRR